METEQSFEKVVPCWQVQYDVAPGIGPGMSGLAPVLAIEPKNHKGKQKEHYGQKLKCAVFKTAVGEKDLFLHHSSGGLPIFLETFLFILRE